METVGRNNIAGGLELVVGRVPVRQGIPNNLGLTVGVAALGEVAGPFERGRDGHRPRAVLDELALKLLTEKEEESRAIAIPIAGNVHRPVELVVPYIVAIRLTRHAALIVKEAIGGLSFMAVKVTAAAVELLAAAARDDGDGTSCIAAVFGGIVRQEHLHFPD